MSEKEGVSVLLMFSSTKWLNSKSRKAIISNLRAADSLNVTGIHLDIEPHTIDGWRDNDYKILESYTGMLKFIRKNWSHFLSVSIPTTYPVRFLKEIYAAAARVNIMAYGNLSISKLQEKIKEEMSCSKTTTTLALRGSDFKNEIEFEERIDSVNVALGIERFAIHNLTQYAELGIAK